MKKSRCDEMVAYASSFVSFILPKIDVEEIILFGSTSRGEAGEESDIDLFFNIKDEKKGKSVQEIINKELKRFYKSKIFEIWSLKSIKNPIKFEVGNLNKWKLKRSIISDGIILYGKYKSMPEETKGFVYFNLKPIKDITKRNRVLRRLFGRKEKNYSIKSLVEEISGKILSPNSFIVPIEKSKEIINLLNPEKLDFSFFEFWSDDVGFG